MIICIETDAGTLSLRDFGNSKLFPALKRRAIVGRRSATLTHPAVSRMISLNDVCGLNFTNRSNFFTSGLRRRMSSKPGAYA